MTKTLNGFPEWNLTPAQRELTANIKTIMAVPIRKRSDDGKEDGSVVGVLTADSMDAVADVFTTKSARGVLEAAAAQISLVLEALHQI